MLSTIHLLAQYQTLSVIDVQLTIGKRFGKSWAFNTHINFSQVSFTIYTNDGSYEISFYSILDGTQHTSGASNFPYKPWNT